MTPLHLRALHIVVEKPRDGYPFALPLVRAQPEIAFTSPVTFLVGENGSGKSTLLEALACAIGSITAGATPVATDPTLAPARALARHMRLSWTKKTRKGLFLRAEDFFGYAKRMAEMRASLEDDLRDMEAEYQNRSAYAKALAQGAIRKEIGEIDSRYGRDGLDARSHGESFLQFFQARFTPNGLYLLDEPEAPLSPLRQLGLVALMNDMLSQGAQFIIATHSPILMAFPGATILQFADGRISSIAWDEVEHVRVTRDFLNNPQRFLQHLLPQDEATA
jgi:predicted ATPase